MSNIVDKIEQYGLQDWIEEVKMNGGWRLFEQARAFARSLGIKKGKEWYEWAKTDVKPDDIPACPSVVYKDEGWVSWGDWLGTDFVAVVKRKYRPFKEVREFVRGLGLNSGRQWEVWAKTEVKPDDIPANPRGAYKDKGWVSMGDWLGSRYRIGGWRLFEEARVFARSLGLKTQKEWCEWAKTEVKPGDIPANPRDAYKDKGWVSVGNWLGSKHRKGGWRPFKEAREFVRSFGLKNQVEWSEWVKTEVKPDDIPSHPSSVYKGKGWVSWGDWFGTGYVAPQRREHRQFEEARDFARSLNFKNQVEWREWAKTDARPDDVPANPSGAYKGNGWASWGDWLGTGFVAVSKRKFRPFKEARAFVRSLGFRNGKEWSEWSKSGQRPDGIPSNPNATYKDKGWVGMKDWLGTA